jgi:cell division protein FtsB
VADRLANDLTAQPAREWLINRRRRTFWGRLLLVALIPLAGFALFTVVQKSVQSYRGQREAAVTYAEVLAEQGENLQLQNELNEARSDAGVEESARRYLNLIKPGDHAVVLSGNLPQPTPTPPPTPTPLLDDDLPAWLEQILTRLGL